MTVATTCIGCGQQLVPMALDSHTAPWNCAHCRLLWWHSELTAAARPAWRKGTADFGYGAPAASIVAAVDQEHAAAVTRGTSLREDQVALVPTATLTALKARGRLDAAFVTAIDAHLAPKVAP